LFTGGLTACVTGGGVVKLSKNAAPYPPSSAPRNDGGQSFSTRERLATEAEKMQKTVIFQKKGSFFTFSG